jgi:hypothetical protein
MRQFALVIALLCPLSGFAGNLKPCVPVAEAHQYLNKDICIAAHVYDVVQLVDGMRFLDVCPPETPDAECKFTVVSSPQDSDDVGELAKYRAMNVQVRGIVEPMHGRAGMVLSHARQFSGGPPKFRPNALLARGFQGDTERPAVNDPDLRAHGGHRAFMNSRDQESRPELHPAR